MKAPKAPRRPQGFAALTPKRRKEIARLGGEAVAKRKGHMAELGRVGGTASQAARRKLGCKYGIKA